MTYSSVLCEPCPRCQTDEEGNTFHAGPFPSDPCDTFISQGFGPLGDHEHSRYCATCQYHAGDHETGAK